MTRNYFNEKLPAYTTPRSLAGRLVDKGTKEEPKEPTTEYVTMHLCSLDNSMDKNKWFYAVKVVNDNKETDKEEVHFFTQEFDAWLYRAKRMGSDTVHFTDYARRLTMDGRVQEEGVIQAAYVPGAAVWDGYVYSEIQNLLG